MNAKTQVAVETVRAVLEAARASIEEFEDLRIKATVHRLKFEIQVPRFEPDNGVSLRNLECFVPAVITLMDAVVKTEGEPLNDEL